MEERVKHNYSTNRKDKKNQKNISYLFHDFIVYLYTMHMEQFAFTFAAIKKMNYSIIMNLILSSVFLLIYIIFCPFKIK